MRRALVLFLALPAAGCLTDQEEFAYLLEHSMDQDDDGHRDPVWEGGDDCNDADPDMHPGAEERCDEKDNDCDGVVDEGFDKAWYQDIDQDGFYSMEAVEGCEPPDDYARHAIGDDCDDRNAAVNLSATEYCDAVDNDCDAQVDEGEAADASTFYLDLDGDGYGDPTSPVLACAQPEDAVVDRSDCDDTHDTVNPGREEVCNDHLDNDCDGTNNDCRRIGTLSPEEADLVLHGSGDYALLGADACGVGDLDGDGVAELAVGAPSFWGTPKVYVLASPIHPDDSIEAAYAIITSDAAGCLGGVIAHSPDITGDGTADLVLGDPCVEFGTPYGDDDGGVFWLTAPAGEVELTSNDMLVDGWSRNMELGFSVASDGDADADGRPDLLVGAPKRAARSTDAGSAFYFYGPVSANTEALDGLERQATTAGTEIGTSVAFVGDMDGDGYDEIAMGGPYRNNSTGFAALERGPIRETGSIGTSPGLGLYGEHEDYRLGWSVSAAGDVNGDGLADALIGAPGANTRWLETPGEVLLIEGDSETAFPYLDHVVLTGQDDDHAGWSVAAAGDFDGDGYDDILIGAPTTDRTRRQHRPRLPRLRPRAARHEPRGRRPHLPGRVRLRSARRLGLRRAGPQRRRLPGPGHQRPRRRHQRQLRRRRLRDLRPRPLSPARPGAAEQKSGVQPLWSCRGRAPTDTTHTLELSCSRTTEGLNSAVRTTCLVRPPESVRPRNRAVNYLGRAPRPR
ncbi:MAG: FG-GAP repeat protein [Alphaproteobacteria bacterium]|nr:FG-GAP repeat protein [Alphaproteobacteria bacterium]